MSILQRLKNYLNKKFKNRAFKKILLKTNHTFVQKIKYLPKHETKTQQIYDLKIR